MPNLLEEETMVVVVVKLCKNAAKPMTTVQDSVSTLVKIIPLGSFNGKKETFSFLCLWQLNGIYLTRRWDVSSRVYVDKTRYF